MDLRCLRLGAASLGALLFAIAWSATAGAQQQPAVVDHMPPGMTAENYNAMVQDIARATAEHIRADRVLDAQPPNSVALPRQGDSVAAGGESALLQIDQMVDRLAQIWSSFNASATYSRLSAQLQMDGYRSGQSLFGLLFLGIAIGVIFEAASGWLIGVIVRRWLRRQVGSVSLLPRVAISAMLDGLTLVPLAIVLYGLSTYLVVNGTLQETVAYIVLGNALIWRASAMVLRIWLRPMAPEIRIVAVTDADARRLYVALSLGVLFYMIGRSHIRILMATDFPTDTIVVAGFANNILYTIVDLSVILAIRHPMARWLESLVDEVNRGWGHSKRMLARNWFIFGIALDVAMCVAIAQGLLAGNLNVGGGISTFLDLLISLILIESLGDFVTTHRKATLALQAADFQSDLTIVATRCLRTVLWIAVCSGIAEIWLLDIFGVVAPTERLAWEHNVSKAVLATTAAYVTWEFACYLMARHLPPTARFAPAPDGQVPTRLATLLPLARVTLGIAISVLTILVVLSELGVNTAPLIAGASVFGLALSFGSQTLVKDIISGVFYLTDDAFRLGEYIDSGKAKGTVEGFTLRSIKLRHQNGQLHIVPFGELGSITNFSRDWITVKFNLRLDRNVDLEVVRKVVKKIGQDILDDPEAGPLVIEPLKMQGIAEINDAALVVRFKFTSKPGKSATVQRMAMKRIYERFPEMGINFAGTAAPVPIALKTV
ncbi:mechanosensitive ion channel family protein [Microvirga antarctica]|uniref:mechanosensitive ion channel family protein n=1 Tax=Microvirga antarctica TaxID=2819233 RepID=UPI001B3087A5|nr:mechanosensitive ion channel domain-containing protein [Microvirga antarctica]